MKFFLVSIVFLYTVIGYAYEYEYKDPTQGKPFVPWLWEDQFQPTIKESLNTKGILTLAIGAATTVAAHQYDVDVYSHNTRGKNTLMSNTATKRLSSIGSGFLGISVAVGQILIDQDNGLMHARAVALTSISHVTLAYAAHRTRPGNRGDYLPFPSSFPSGHTSSAFATATALSYAYGWKAGVPAFLLATSIGMARVVDNAHWLSDVTAGAALGIFWGHASYEALTKKSNEAESKSVWTPYISQDGTGVVFYHALD
ncbi:MAG: phosphatase PAP2 family protein [Pseudobdellovibrio sp.]